jgi:hypothetical protein
MAASWSATGMITVATLVARAVSVGMACSVSVRGRLGEAVISTDGPTAGNLSVPPAGSARRGGRRSAVVAAAEVTAIAEAATTVVAAEEAAVVLAG